MAMIEIVDVCPERPFFRLEMPVPGLFAAYIRRRKQWRAYARLARLPDRLIRDAGLDPDAVRDAVSGPWDETGHLRIR